jgi:hypothetical protein
MPHKMNYKILRPFYRIAIKDMCMKYFLSALLLCYSLFTKAQEFGGIHPRIKWYQINTPQAKIIFPKGLDSQANHIANTIATAAASTTNTIGGKTKKWNIVLQHQTIVPNAYVRMGPRRSEFYLTPDFDNITSGSLRWDELLANHEYRHIQQFTNFNNGLAKLFSFLLGQQGQLLANGMTIPDYFFEGDAVYQETMLSGQGRGRLPAFFSGMKALQLEKKNYNWMKMRNGSLRHFVPGHYELGYQVVAYGYEKYGKDFWQKVTQDASAFKGLFYAWQKAIKKYSGKSYSDFTKEAVAYFAPTTATQQGQPVMPVTKTVTDYHFPQADADGNIIVLKQSYKQIPTFVVIKNGTEQKLRVKDIGIDNYFSYNAGKIVYSAYTTDARWAWKNYSVIRVLDVATGKQQQLTHQSKYFNPDISKDGKYILATNMAPNTANQIELLDAVTGGIIKKTPNLNNYIFTQTKFIDADNAISVARDITGQSALVTVNLTTGATATLTPFTFTAIGNPSLQNDTVYFNIATAGADNIAACDLKTKKIFLLSQYANSVFYPGVINNRLTYAAVTTTGSRLMQAPVSTLNWQATGFATIAPPVTPLASVNSKTETATTKTTYTATRYRKGLHLFNFHSARPAAADNEYSFSLLSDNILNTFSSDLTYTYNVDERSHTVGYSGTYGAWFPLLTAGVATTFNRNYLINNVPVAFNTAKLFTGFNVPLQFVTGKSSGAIQFGGTFTAEQFYSGPGKNIFNNSSFNYATMFVGITNVIQIANQHIFPRWGQRVVVSYRDALNQIDNKKLVVNSTFYFPGFFNTHNILINASYQKRDTLTDLFSRTFNFSRGYEALNTRRMYRLGVNYHFPLFYPDAGIGNIAYVQRVRANTFYDYTNIRARLNNVLTNFTARSAGAEIFFDGKIWNAFPVSIGMRFTHLLDTDLIYPTRTNLFEVILPVGLVGR